MLKNEGVANILGYAKSLNAIVMHVDEDDSLKQGLIDSLGRTQQTIFINELGLYSLILSGKDVARILGYANASKALFDHVDDEDKLNNESLSSLGQRGE